MLLKQCTEFVSGHARIVLTSPSGTNAHDFTRLATSFFNDMKFDAPDDDLGPPFKHQAAYR